MFCEVRGQCRKEGRSRERKKRLEKDRMVKAIGREKVEAGGGEERMGDEMETENAAERKGKKTYKGGQDAQVR